MHVRPALALAVAAGVVLSACSAPSPGGAAPRSPVSSTAAPTAAGPSTAPTSTGPQASPNGVAEASAGEAMARAAAALAGARSVHVVGDVRSEGTHVVLDLDVAAGRRGRGTVTLDGARIDVVATADAVYLGGNATFLERAAGKGAADLFRGKYLRTTRDDPAFRPIADFLDLRSLAKNLLPTEGLDGSATTTVGGSAARVLEDGAGGSYVIATVGPPYPLALEGGDATASLDLTFSRYGAKVDLTAPPRTEVVDLADLKR